jgi:hypothetical protein
LSFVLFAIVPLKNPRTECGRQSVHFTSSFKDIQPPQRAQDLCCLAALPGTGGGLGVFGGLLAFGPPFRRARFLSRPWLAGATWRLCGVMLARWVVFGRCTGAGVLASSSAFDVIVNVLLRQNAGFRTSVPPMWPKSKSGIRGPVSPIPRDETRQNSVDFASITP